jgi:uncharacterized protein YegL
MSGYLHLPVDNDICVHTIKFSCAGREVELVCRKSKQARHIFESAKETGQWCYVMNKPEDRVSTIELGNLPPDSEIILTMNMTILAASSSPNSIFFKFPFESCSPTGKIVTLDSAKIESFLFEQEIEEFEAIGSVTSNLGGEWIPANDRSGVFRLTRPTADASLILNTTFPRAITKSSAVQFGEIVAVFAIPEAAQLGSTIPQEYLFILDCSGSMNGNRIRKAIECLQLYLHSLPTDGYFNIVRFGSRHDAMWPLSRAVNEDNITAALEYTKNVQADLGGTEMSNPLNWIFESEAVFRRKQRQLFILTDGEDFHPDQVMSLVSAHRKEMRCFTIGIGHGADPGLVKGIATRTNGRYDFVYNGVDLRTKVIGHLAAALAPTIDNVSVQVSGASWQHVVQNPVQPMIPENLSTIFVHCQNQESGARVLVAGTLQGRDIEYVSELTSICADESMIKAVSKYVDMTRLTDLEHAISQQKKHGKTRASLIQQSVAISIRSGILCSYTSFVGVVTQSGPVREKPRTFVWCGRRHGYVCVELDRNDPNPCQTIVNAVSSKVGSPAEQVRIEFQGTSFSDFYDCQVLRCERTTEGTISFFVKTLTGKHFDLSALPTESICDIKMMIQDLEGIPTDQQRLIYAGKQLEDDQTMDELGIIDGCTFHLVLRLRGGGGPPLIISELERAMKENDVSTFLDGHSVEGCWVNAEAMMTKSGLITPPTLPTVRPDMAAKVLATVLALAILRKRYSDQRDIWQLLELKALKWLDQVHGGADWSQIINSIIATLE